MIEQLQREGYSRDDIIVYTNKDAFSADTYEYDSSLNEEADHANNDPLYQYRDDISAGKIIITVNNYKNDPTENVTGRHAAGDTSTNNLHASDAALI